METIHRSDKSGKHHLVGIGSLRVVINQANGHWFAQGLEIDYAAEGTSLDDVKVRFEKGLIATVGEHIKRFRSIERFLVPAPAEVWREVTVGAAVKRLVFNCVSAHIADKMKEELPDDQEFPYGDIAYLQQANVQQA